METGRIGGRYKIRETNGGKVKKFLSLTVILLITPVSSLAYGASLELLRELPGAVSRGMGNVSAASSGDVFSISSNPGILSTLDHRLAAVSHTKLAGDIQYDYISAALPGLFRGFSLGLGSGLAGYGRVLRTTLSDKTGAGGDYFYGSSFFISSTAATRFRVVLPFLPSGTFYPGISLKYAREKLDIYSAGSFTIDAGVLYCFSVGKYDLSAGLSGANLAGGLKYFTELEPFPSVLSVGGKIGIPEYSLSFEGDIRLLVGTGARLMLGAEWTFRRIFKLRGGFDTSKLEGDKLTFGFGIEGKNMEASYAYIPFSRGLKQDNLFVFSVTIK